MNFRLLLHTAILASMTYGVCPAQAGNYLPYPSDWKAFQADNGRNYFLDMKSIQAAMNNGAIATMYVEGTVQARQYYFSCRNTMQDVITGSVSFLPSMSVGASVSDEACKIAASKRPELEARRRRIEAEQNDRRIHPRPEDYCQGFSQSSCEAMKADVDRALENKASPTYCVDGFALADSGVNLTPERQRVCYVTSAIFNDVK